MLFEKGWSDMMWKNRNVQRVGWGVIAAALLFSSSLHASAIEFQVTPLGSGVYRYNYMVSGFQFQANQELDLRFDPALYGALSNGVAPPGFDLLLLQPNNPPGTSGDYSALALVNMPSLTPFSVDFAFLGAGVPGPQPFFINQLDASGNLIATIASGSTTSATARAPEPRSFSLVSLALLMGGAAVCFKGRRRLGRFAEDKTRISAE